jgi:hypothetical protein
MRDKPLPADRLMLDLNSFQVHAIDQLRSNGYGDGTPASVVEYALNRFIDDLRRAGIVAPPSAPDAD